VYTAPYTGRKSANGQFSTTMHDRRAPHLAYGSLVVVTNLKTGNRVSCALRTGPFVEAGFWI